MNFVLFSVIVGLTVGSEVGDRIKRLVDAEEDSWPLYFIPQYEDDLLKTFDAELVKERMAANARRCLKTLKQVGSKSRHRSPSKDLKSVRARSRSASKDRENVDRDIALLWKDIESVSEHLELVVNLPNEAVLRYAVGVKRATELLLTMGGLQTVLLATDSYQTLRLVYPLSSLLSPTLPALHKLARVMSGSNMSLLDPLVRPSRRAEMEFLLGREMAERKLSMFAARVPGMMLAELDKKDLVERRLFGTYTGLIFEAFKRNIATYSYPFTLMSFADQDVLALAVGEENARELIRLRTEQVVPMMKKLSSRFQQEALSVRKRKDVDWVRFLKVNVVPNLRDFADMFSCYECLELLVGATHAAVINQDGLDKPLTFKNGETLTTFEALRPSKDRLSVAFESALLAEEIF